MKVVKLEDILGTEKEVEGGNWVSRRLISKKKTEWVIL